MSPLKLRDQRIIGVALAILLVMTRGYHMPGLDQLPSASWAVFFIAGLYLQSKWAFPIYMAMAVAIDALAVGWAGVSSYCVSPAYAMLLPAYASLWLAGRWCSSRLRFASGHYLRSLVYLACAVAMAGVVCELLSGGGFYAFSGRFAEPTLSVYAERFVRYFPSYFVSLAFWVALVVGVHAVVAQFGQRRAQLSA